MKIVVVGAASRTFGLRTVTDVLAAPAMRELDSELALLDIDERGLAATLELAGMLKAHFGACTRISATTDRVQALRGADYVLVSVTQRRYELWEQDYRVPLAHGFRQAYAENGGPGALFHALRNIHLVMSVCQDVERLCPQAMVFSYSNPESRILLAIRMLTSLRAVGLCHGQLDALRTVSRLIEKPEGEIEILGAGINHLFWLYRISDRLTGADLYPRLREAAARNTDPHFALPKKLLAVYGMLTYPDNTHAGEFLSFGAEYLGYKWVHGLESRPVTVPHARQADPMGPYLRGERPIGEIAQPSREFGVPMILAHALDRRARFIAGNVLNDGLYLPDVQTDGIVEVPVEVDGRGFHPERVPPLPDGIAGMVRTQMTIQKLTVLAYRERSKKMILQALLADPTVDSIVRAEALIEDMLSLQAEFLPTFR